MSPKAKKWIIRISVAAAILVVLIFVAVPLGVSIYLYEDVFGERYTTDEALAFKLEDFDGLCADRYEFTSDKGQTLVGYRYYVEDGVDARGVVVIAHGLGGGGHNSYMDAAYFFASNGYDVFAYDATGNDESEGDTARGLPQGVIDLDYAIDFLDKIDDLKDLPVMLFGHSWGGYSVGAVLNYHPEVRAVVSFSGFDRSSDMILAQGEQMVGGVIKLFAPYVNLYERLKFGGYASATSMEGFANSSAGVYIVHSSDDTVVPPRCGYDKYYAKYSEDPRFKFVLFSDRGHNNVIYSEDGIAYLNDLNKEFREAYPEVSPSAEERAAYIAEHLDREQYAGMLDKALFSDILAFFDSYL